MDSYVHIETEERTSYNKHKIIKFDTKALNTYIDYFFNIKRISKTILQYQMHYGCNSFECNCSYCASCPDFLFYFNKEIIESIIDQIIEQITIEEFLDYIYSYPNNINYGNFIFNSKKVGKYFCKNNSPLIINLQQNLSNIQQLERLFSNIIQNKDVSNKEKQIFKHLIVNINYFSYLLYNNKNNTNITIPKLDKITLCIDMNQFESIQTKLLKKDCNIQLYSSSFTVLLESFYKTLINDHQNIQQNSLVLIRGLLILSIYTKMFKHPFITTNFYIFVKIIYNLKKKDLFFSYMSKSKAIFSNFLGLLNENLSYIIKNQKLQVHSDIVDMLTSIIDTMYKINISNLNNNKQSLHYTEFINKELSTEINLQLEKSLYLQKNQKSYIYKPSLLTTQCKIDMARSFLLMEHEKHIKISRTFLYYHTLELFSNMNDLDLKNGIRVNFSDEIGFDNGGLTKEFLELASTQIFSVKTNYFIQLKRNNGLFFNLQNAFSSDSTFIWETKNYYKTAGQILGLMWREGITLPVCLAPQMIKILKSDQLTIQEIKELDEESFSSLMHLRKMKEENQPIEDLSLFFTYLTSDSHTKLRLEIPFCDYGELIPVTNDNIDYFIEYNLTLYKNKKVINIIINPFIDGLNSTANKIFLELFTADEINKLISRDTQQLNWFEFQLNIKYEGWQNKKNKTLNDFWQIFHSWSETEKRKFLKFLTGSASEPVNGFSKVNITFERGTDTKYLPVAHTCANILILPDYRDYELLKKNLTICINNSETFGII